MRVLKGDCDYVSRELPEDVALFLAGMAVGGNLESVCRTEVLKAYEQDKKGTKFLARRIGLDLRKCVLQNNPVFSKNY